MRQETIPITLVLEYVSACHAISVAIADYYAQHPHQPMPDPVMGLIAANSVLDMNLRRYKRTGKWEGLPPFFAKYPETPLTIPLPPKRTLRLVPPSPLRPGHDDTPRCA